MTHTTTPTDLVGGCVFASDDAECLLRAHAAHDHDVSSPR